MGGSHYPILKTHSCELREHAYHAMFRCSRCSRFRSDACSGSALRRMCGGPQSPAEQGIQSRHDQRRGIGDSGRHADTGGVSAPPAPDTGGVTVPGARRTPAVFCARRHPDTGGVSAPAAFRPAAQLSQWHFQDRRYDSAGDSPADNSHRRSHHFEQHCTSRRNHLDRGRGRKGGSLAPGGTSGSAADRIRRHRRGWWKAAGARLARAPWRGDTILVPTLRQFRSRTRRAPRRQVFAPSILSTPSISPRLRHHAATGRYLAKPSPAAPKATP